MKISYNKRALKAAAQYVWDNNPAVTMWPDAPRDVEDVEACIKDNMHRGARENAAYIKAGTADANWRTYSGTGGYLFIFSAEEDDTVINVDIYVQPTYNHKFVTKKLRLSDE